MSRSTPQASPLRPARTLGRLELLALLALIAAGPLAWWAGHRPADVGLDLSAIPAQAPFLSWGVGGSSRTVMQRIDFRPLPSQPKARYYAQIPRRALADLRLTLSGGGSHVVDRLYIGTFVPLIYYPNGWNRYSRILGDKFSGPIPTQAHAPLAHLELVAAEHSTVRLWGILALAIFLCLVPLAMAGAWFCRMGRWLIHNPPQSIPLARFRGRDLWLFTLPPLLLWLFVLGCFYPALMSNDSLSQWWEIQSMALTTYHSALLELMLKPITLAWNSPAAIALAQIFLLVSCLAATFVFLIRTSIPRKIVLLAFAITALSPRNALMAITLWIDLWYAALMLLFTLMLAIALFNTAWLKKPAYWIVSGVLLGLLPLLRHNGQLLLAGMGPLLILFFWRERKLAILAPLVALITLFGIEHGLYPAFKVKVFPTSGFLAGIYTTRTAPAIAQDLPLAPAEVTFLSQVKPLNRNWYGFYIPTEYSMNHIREFRRLLGSLILRYPLPFLDNFARAPEFVYCPPRLLRDYGLSNPLDIPANNMGLRQTPLFPRAKDAIVRGLERTLSPRLDWLFWRPALDLYLVLLAAALLVHRTGNPRFLILFAPVLLNTLSIVLAASTPDYRYQYPLTLATAFLCALAGLPRAAVCPQTADQP